MTDKEYDGEILSRGVISYALEDGNVAHGIVALDPITGQQIATLAGIVLTPEIARSVAANLTWQSMRAEEGQKK